MTNLSPTGRHVKPRMLSDDEADVWYESDESNEADAAAATVVADPEVWMDHWSEELVTLWHALTDHSAAMGCAILDKCDFPTFAEFCFKHSSGHPPVV